MAFYAQKSTTTLAAVAGADIPEGRAVVIDTTVTDVLPVVVPAPANATNIFVVFAAPDTFARPTPQDMFKYNPYAIATNGNIPRAHKMFHPQYAQPYAVESGQYGNMYLIGPSLMENPILYRGWLVQIHRGGAYTIPSGGYVDSASIRVPGATVGVAAGGLFQYSTTNVVGTVVEYRDGELTILINP